MLAFKRVLYLINDQHAVRRGLANLILSRFFQILAISSFKCLYKREKNRQMAIK